MVLKDNLDIIANNVANVNTPGYRAQNLLFAEHVAKERGDIDPMSFVYDKGQYKNTLPGPVHVTGNPLDASIEGPGFFGVVGPDGKTYYTRAGNFIMDAEGALFTQSGHPVADAGGSPIVIPTNSTEIKIDDKGVISNQEGQVGQLMVTEFDDPQQLKPYGDNMYATTEQGTPAVTSVVKQGQLEGSNVLAVTEITRMIDTLRNFQSMQNILQAENERMRTAIQRLTKS
jgi:flagellar basal-body rod protein FlgF